MLKKCFAVLAVSLLPLMAGSPVSASPQAGDAQVSSVQKNPMVTYDYYTGEPVEPDDGFSSDAQ